jgi:hypothetical protein
MGYKPDFEEDIKQSILPTGTNNSSVNNLLFEDEERDHHLKPMNMVKRSEKDKSWTKTRCYSKLPDFYEILNFGPEDRDYSDYSSIFKPISWQN